MKKIINILLFNFLFLTYCVGQTNNCRIEIKSRESNVIVNCGSGNQIYRGQKEIQKYFKKLLQDNQRLSQELRATYENTVDIKNKLSELANISMQILLIQSQLPDLIASKTENEEIVKLGVEVLLLKEEFKGANAALSNVKNTQSYARLIELTSSLMELDSKAIVSKNDGNYLLQLKYLTEIKRLNKGDQIINDRLRETNDAFLNFCQNEIINQFDIANNVGGAIPNESSPEFIVIYDKFVKSYNASTIEMTGYEKWRQDLNDMIEKACTTYDCKSIHSEVLYKMSFMIFHNFAKVKSKRKPLALEFEKKLSSLIDISIKFSAARDMEKKKALRKSITSK